MLKNKRIRMLILLTIASILSVVVCWNCNVFAEGSEVADHSLDFIPVNVRGIVFYTAGIGLGLFVAIKTISQYLIKQQVSEPTKNSEGDYDYQNLFTIQQSQADRLNEMDSRLNGMDEAIRDGFRDIKNQLREHRTKVEPSDPTFKRY